MLEKIPYNSKTHTGVTPVDCKAIHLAMQQGEKLSIDPAGNIYDSRRVCIAKGKERVQNDRQRDIHGN
ncbi:MAG: hypothetical protein K2G04_09770 [Oscillospiraceae bacterium]|nr:hypothetical protein [Oscillospiraceae bacterium]